jgi:aryl-alcohol dehydrogenase-like predicted oxidoreductase
LGTDHVDLYQVHRMTADADVDGILETLSELVDAGKVLAIGTSALLPEQIVEFKWRAEVGSYCSPVSEQPPYSIFVRAIEAGVIPTCRRHKITIVAHAPLNGGWLGGRYRLSERLPVDSRASTWPIRRERYDVLRPEVNRKLKLVEELDQIATAAGMPLVEMATRFALSHEDVSAVIIGPRTSEQLAALPTSAPLEEDILRRIDAVVAPGETVDPEDRICYMVPELLDAHRARMASTAASSDAESSSAASADAAGPASRVHA